jgi:hypothetical protein
MPPAQGGPARGSSGHSPDAMTAARRRDPERPSRAIRWLRVFPRRVPRLYGSCVNGGSPWYVVLAQVRDPSDALALMWLYESCNSELLANGTSIGEILEFVPSERGVSALLAKHLTSIDGEPWTYTDFYGPSRGSLNPTMEDVEALCRRCELAGVLLRCADVSMPTRDDGVPE